MTDEELERTLVRLINVEFESQTLLRDAIASIESAVARLAALVEARRSSGNSGRLES